MEPILTWTSIGGQPFNARLYADGDRYSLWIDPMGWFHIDGGVPSITVPPGSEARLREQRLWGIPAALCFIHRGDIPLHASAVDVEGSALLFAAPGRFGKTTLAAAFLQAGHRVLSEDISCCRTDGTPSVLPGPSVLRVRRDTYERLEFPGTYLVAEEPHRVHLAIEEGLRGDGLPVPLRGIVFLREGDLDMQRVPTQASLRDLWTLSFKLPTDPARARCFQGIAALASGVPVWNLHRPLTFTSLGSVIERIVSTCLNP
jgi:hypothetical protein